jgi:hypothetical protein
MRGFGILGINGMFGFSWNNLRYSKYRRIAFKLYTFLQSNGHISQISSLYSQTFS